MDLHLDYDAVGELLRIACREPINAIAAEVAANVDAGTRPVRVRPYDTDRAAAAVTIYSRDALAYQARTGALTKAAASVGLEVRAKDAP